MSKELDIAPTKRKRFSCGACKQRFYTYAGLMDHAYICQKQTRYKRKHIELHYSDIHSNRECVTCFDWEKELRSVV